MPFTDIVLLLARGAGHTILVTLACIVMALGSGMTIAVLYRLENRVLSFCLRVYTYVFRGIPVLVLLFIVFFGLPGAGLPVHPLLAMMLSLGLIAGAYLGEVFRGALNAVDPGEIMAAEASGLSRQQILLAIELPQMLRFAVPGMVNEFTTILKYSPFAYTVGVPEVMKQAMALSATTLRGVEIFFAVGLIYFVIYKALVSLVWALDRHFHIPGFGDR